ncbi:MAG: hypothetical protein COB85_08030 [Bacteroidetes bacterium]|nr:MAG: hypothetical protein COB85_08030 [Bacteroidota bacterium]
MSDSPVVQTDGTTLSKFNEDTIRIKFKDGANVNLEEAIEIRDQSFLLFPDRKFLALVDASKIFGNVSPEALKFFAQDELLISRRMAQAIVVDNLALKILANFYLRVMQPKREAKIFSKEEDAISWLSERKHLLE